MSVTMRLETITPAKAQKWLDERAKNRPIRQYHVARLVNAIKAGEWEVNGENIKFNVNNEMFDGQHRCQAVVVSQTPIQSYVTRGLPVKTFDTVDEGCPRSTPDVFHKRDEKNCKELSNSINWLWRHLNDYVTCGRTNSPRKPEAFDVLNSNPAIRDSLRKVSSMKLGLSRGLAACLHYLFSLSDQEAADAFFSGLASGENLSKSNETSSILLLRNILADNKASHAKIPSHHLWALTVKAWNNYQAGKVVKTLRYVHGREEFPLIK